MMNSSSLPALVADMHRSLDDAFTLFNWVLGLSIGMFTCVVGLGSVLAIFAVRQNSKLRQLHSDYEEKLHELNSKRLEVTERANDINKLEKRSLVISSLLLTQSLVTRTYLLIPKLETAIAAALVNHDPNGPLLKNAQGLVQEIIDEFLKYSNEAYANISALKLELATLHDVPDALRREVYSLAVRIAVSFGIVYKRQYVINRVDALLYNAVYHLEQAKEDALRLESNNELARLHFNLACYYALLKNFDKAQSNLDLAVDKNLRYSMLSLTDADLEGLRQARPNNFSSIEGDMLN